MAAVSSSSSAQDPLDLIRSTIQTGAADGNPLSAFTFLDQAGSPTDTVVKAHTIRLGDVTFEKAAATRLARSRDELAARLQAGSAPSLTAEPGFFYTVEAVILGLQARDERPGAYLAQAAAAKVASFPALDRAAILDYLLGRRSEWAGVLPLSSVSAASSAQQHATDGAAISAQTSAPGQTSTLPSTASGAAGVKRPYKVNQADVEFVKRIRAEYEVVLRTRNDALHGDATTAAGGQVAPGQRVTDFEGFRRAFSAKVEAARKLAGRGPPAGSNAATAAARMGAAGQVRKQRAQDPIIVISNSPTSLLNMFNIKQFLEEGIFVPPEEARQRARGVADLVVSITSRAGSSSGAGVGIGRRILVVDNAEAVDRLASSGAGLSAPGSDPWSRVIAVFTTGQTWQFKTYRWSDPRELFKHVMGTYARWHNEPQNPNIRDWNVLELQIDRTKRHTDKQIVSYFWRQLEGWVQRRKPNLITA
ncbi:CDC73-domain-containing protein [Testicularia cyperi]|uniref:CDC73-domain-containing protein n=1 Tax=Testicularia cyperi TaxID=1882483 RepID=A0A317XVZ3_9BASI|nr:CDC73-domain-containing protein [Testicularia cyperi]